MCHAKILKVLGKMAKTGILIISNPNKFNNVIPRIMTEVKNTLYIHFHPDGQTQINPKFKQPCSHSLSVIDLYKSSLKLRDIDVRVLLSSFRSPSMQEIRTKNPIDIVYFADKIDQDLQGFVSSYVKNKSIGIQAVSLTESSSGAEDPPALHTCKMYNNVVLGGTFDRLHIGHKILLSEAVLRCNRKITVGITDLNMTKSKKLWELIEPCDLRIQKVQNFLEDVEPGLEYDVVPIHDMFGPTKDDPTFELIIVSAETAGGGNKVNEVRAKNGLNPMDVHIVGVIPEERQDEEEEDKVSSSNERLRLLGTLLIPPQPKRHIPSLPYTIGLTGGIASGKSSLSLRLQGQGAAIVDCDKIAHQLYQKDTPIYHKILESFGTDLMDESGEINRRKLGEIVFHNKDRLEELNNLLWPAILIKCKEISQELYKSGKKVVVWEAAVLLMAGWDDHCHEVWSSIVPTQEAVRRLKERNNMTEEDALARISSQPSNLEIVNKSNVVFCTLWRPEYSQKQVEKAWNLLMKRLPT